MAHTSESIQTWVDNYRVITNKLASYDILHNIVVNLEDHSFSYGPTPANGYILTISGDIVNRTFVVKADE